MIFNNFKAMLFRRPFFNMKPGSVSLLFPFAVAISILLSPVIQAQWQTQSITLESGWNPVYLNVDASHSDISDLVGNIPIEAIWLWSPSANEAQYVLSPDAPSETKSRWIEWRNTLGDATSQLKSLVGNAAYLIKLKDGEATTTFNVKGKVIPPNYYWTTSGLNFVGFPVNPSQSWNLESYFLKGSFSFSSTTFFNYTSGNLGPNNPAQVFGLRSTPLIRGRAYWVKPGSDFNQYYGPVRIQMQNIDGLDFGENVQTTRFRVRNMTSSNITIRLSSKASETSPLSNILEEDIQGALMIRTALDPDTQTYNFEACPCENVEIILAPKGNDGQDAEVVVGLNRSLLKGQPGAVHSGIFVVEDNLEQSTINLPIHAVKQSFEGLWVGDAIVHGVSRATQESTEAVSSEYPLRFILHQKNIPITTTQAAPEGTAKTVTISPTNTALNVGETIKFSNGTALTLTAQTSINGTTIVGDVIGANGISSGLSGNVSRVQLMQRVYIGLLPGGVPALANQESLLDSTTLEDANRISTIHLPFSEENLTWPISGELSQAGTMSTVVTVEHDDHIANPFLHTYHPDHDNLNADFDTNLNRGFESFAIQREFTFNSVPSAGGFNGMVSMGNTISGTFQEIMTLKGKVTETAPNQNKYTLSGVFKFVRISPLSTLITP